MALQAAQRAVGGPVTINAAVARCALLPKPPRPRERTYTVNQLHRQPLFQGGTDLRERPYAVMRTPIDGEPVRLRP
jgi:hypothetical protein